MFLEQLHVLGMIRENWRSALPSRAQPRRKDLKILHPSDQMSEVQGWPDAKPGLSRRCSATGQLAGLLKMNIDCFLCLESFSGSPFPPGERVPKPVVCCTVLLQLHLQLLMSLVSHWLPFPSWKSACSLLPQGLCSCCVCHLELFSNLIT